MPDDRAQRVLLVSRNMPPLIGGMERLNWHIADELGRRLALEVVAPRGSALLAPSDVVPCEVSPKPLPVFLASATLAAIRIAKTFRPDVVLAGSGLMAPVAELAARSIGAKSVSYVHGLDVVVENLIYKAIWLPSIRRMDRVIANSRFTARLCGDVGIRKERIGIVHPGVQARPSQPAGEAGARAFRRLHSLG